MALLSRLLRWLRGGDHAPELTPLPGEIIDWNQLDSVGAVQLPDSAVLSFHGAACRDFRPLIGLPVDVLGVGMPPGEAPGALQATALRLRPGGEEAYAAAVRLHDLERSLQGPARAPAAPPAGPARRRPAGPERPGDGFFVFTLLLNRALPADPAQLAALLRGPEVPAPTVRIIPLVRRGHREPGFSAEICEGGRRAFLLFRPQPYQGDPAPCHAGLFVGGPHSPRAAALLGRSAEPGPLAPGGEVRWLGGLLRALLRTDAGVAGVVINRAGRARKPAEMALVQLGEEDGGHVPVLLWIDWELRERDGRRLQLSSGMESLGLPDVGVLLPAGDESDGAVARSRDALWFACTELARGALPPDAAELAVPRELQLLPGSRLRAADGAACDRYAVLARDEELLLLEPC